MRGQYDLVFSHEHGDPARPRFAAGWGVFLSSKLWFHYRGAIFWKLRAGMGEAVFAPLYQALVARGVQFRFFAEVMAPVMSSVPTTEAELTDLWRRLVKYASTSAWVTAVHEEKESVRFHPEIVPVQRTLIREDPVTVRLHLAAAPWFAAIADEHPDTWTPYASESIYHAFQTDPAAGVTAWRRAIDTARKAGRPARAQAVPPREEEHAGTDQRSAEEQILRGRKLPDKVRRRRVRRRPRRRRAEILDEAVDRHKTGQCDHQDPRAPADRRRRLLPRELSGQLVRRPEGRNRCSLGLGRRGALALETLGRFPQVIFPLGEKAGASRSATKQAAELREVALDHASTA